jgi:excisionase family DNA binding protein
MFMRLGSDMEQEYLTVRHVAKLLGLSERRVRTLITNKELRAVRVGVGERGELRIAKSDLASFLRTRETKPEDLSLAG